MPSTDTTTRLPALPSPASPTLPHALPAPGRSTLPDALPAPGRSTLPDTLPGGRGLPLRSIPDPTPADAGTMAPDAPPVHGALPLDALEEGDVVFVARPGFLQDLCTRAGEPWRHVGVITWHHGERAIVEVAGAHFGQRPLPRMAATASAIAVARLPGEARPTARAVARWCGRHCGRSQVYAWDDLVLAGFISATRLYCPTRLQPELPAVIGAAAGRMRQLRDDAGPGVDRHTCSSFVASGFTASGLPLQIDLRTSRSPTGPRPLLDLLRSRPRPTRAAPGTHISPAQAGAVIRSLVAGVTSRPTGTAGPGADDWTRWVTPGDIWRSTTFAERYDVERPERP